MYKIICKNRNYILQIQKKKGYFTVQAKIFVYAICILFLLFTICEILNVTFPDNRVSKITINVTVFTNLFVHTV